MQKKEYIKYWVNSANHDIKSCIILIASKRNLHALFFAHLYLEKLCKAIWVSNNVDNIPPRTHNLIFILEKSNIDIPTEVMNFLLVRTSEIINQTKITGKWLLNQIH